ncbi:polyadenylate-binding protein 2-B-like [Amphiura filiformis]|uniref:polyadenylate-binding protein 2-B-like n=1 Tax=Amphiura filiformis TaxID=82378 RepID=UPI003B2117F9
MADEGAVDLGQEYIQDDQLDHHDQGLGLGEGDEEDPPGLNVSTGAEEAEGGVEDAELQAIKARVREMEEEAEKLKEMQNEVEKQMNLTSPTTTGGPPAHLSLEDKVEVDNRSVYVGNVDYSATAEELEQHFHGCGNINRVTILCDKFTGHPKGFAYVEFTDKEDVQLGLALDESLFKGRQIKVNIKRTNRPGISTTDRPNRARGGGGYRGRGRGGGSYYGGSPYYSGYVPRRSRGFRPRRYTRYSPY